MTFPLPLNPALKTLPVYVPGRPIEEVARELNLKAQEIIKLASNENPLGPSPQAMAALQKTISQVHLYPDGSAFYLKQRLSNHLRLPTDHLVLGNGSNEIIEFVGHALLSPGDNIVVSDYCFAIYPIVAKMFGADVISVPARQYGHDLEAMASAITPRTRIVFVANPNNPTGTLVPPDAVRALIERVPPHVLLVMDEAYIEFLEKPLDLTDIVREGTRPNLLLMRTFSKIYGLAGLRVGYGIGHPGLISALEKVRQPFNINTLAQVAALAALDDQAHVEKTRETNLAGLQQLERGFLRLGLEFVPSFANFILVKVGDGHGVFQQLQKAGIIVRPMGGYQLPEWIRISVGTPEENERCLAALPACLAKK